MTPSSHALLGILQCKSTYCTLAREGSNQSKTTREHRAMGRLSFSKMNGAPTTLHGWSADSFAIEDVRVRREAAPELLLALP
jgi:hypothetical protein